MIKILILDEDKPTRLGIKQFFSDDQVEIVGDASTWLDGLKLVQEKKPHIVLLEINLPDAAGNHVVDFLARNYSTIKTIYLTKNRHIPTLHRLITKTPAKGLLNKDLNFSGIEAIKSVFQGRTFIDPNLSYELINYRDDIWSRLTNRESFIISEILEGRSLFEIANKSNISQKTVANTKINAFKKLEIKSFEQLTELISSPK